MVSGNSNSRQHNGTNSTKIFVGGLAWGTQRDTMRRYFEQFGEIIEAVVITDKNTGRSKGYGFVTFKDPRAAIRACENPSPIIDGRRTNCNIAYIGANKNRPQTPQHGRFRAAYHGPSSTFIHQNTGRYSFPNSNYGYTGYSQDTMYPMNSYGVFGGQQFLNYYPAFNGASGPVGLVHNMYPFSAQYAYNSHLAHGFGVQYPQMMQFPFHHRHLGSAGILRLPSSSAIPIMTAVTTTATTTTTETTATGVGDSQAARIGTGTISEQNSST